MDFSSATEPNSRLDLYPQIYLHVCRMALAKLLPLLEPTFEVYNA